MNHTYRENFEKWLRSGKLSEDEMSALIAIKDDEKEIKSRFSSFLSFGTAGLRGTL